MRSALLFVPGLLTGLGLVLSGMTDPARVLGFLDLAGPWDPSLAFVMVGAMTVFGVGSRLVLRRGAPVQGGRFPSPPSHEVDGRLLLGAVLFGTGWGLVGLCPGPALVGLGALHAEALLFVWLMLVGMVIAQRAFGADR